MTYKTCKILTRLKTAPHVSMARRMEPFAKHLLNLASWLEQLYPSQGSVSALLTADWDWWNLSSQKHCSAMLLYHCCVCSAFSSSSAPRHNSQGSCTPAVAPEGSSQAEITQLQEDAPRASPFVHTALAFCSPAPFSVSSQVIQRNSWEQPEKVQKVNLLICALYQKVNISHLVLCERFFKITPP